MLWLWLWKQAFANLNFKIGLEEPISFVEGELARWSSETEGTTHDRDERGRKRRVLAAPKVIVCPTPPLGDKQWRPRQWRPRCVPPSSSLYVPPSPRRTTS